MKRDSIAERIFLHNDGRIPLVLEMKYARMREDAVCFFRGTCHLFADTFPQEKFLAEAPLAWQCGDLHLENFGSYKGDNRLTYFDVNDFDEALLAPCLLDPMRLLCSVFLVAQSLGIPVRTVRSLASGFVRAYATALSEGYIRMVEKEVAEGEVGDLLQHAAGRSRKTFIKSRTTKKKGKLKLVQVAGKMIPMDKSMCRELAEEMKRWAKQEENPNFFKVIDAAFRTVGTGSLGQERYMILVEGRGGRANHFLLDLKEARPSAMAAKLLKLQPDWGDEAERIITLQQRMQSCPPALLHDFTFGGKSFVLRELQPSEDKIEYHHFARDNRKFGAFLQTLGGLCAWSALRSGGRQGSANADALIAFGKEHVRWEKRLPEAAEAYAAQARADYKAYCVSYDNGYFKQKHKP